MRLFQNSGLYPAYIPRLERLTRGLNTFAARKDAFLADRFGACHFLQPVLSAEPEVFFTNADDAGLQRKWAEEQGLPASADMSSILLAQIEHHRSEVFYNLDPMRYSSNFVRRLPATVRRTIAWRAAPSPGADFSAYDLVVCNFPSILRSYEERGWRAAYLAPAHDPVMDRYAANIERPVDVLFVGGYSRHHRRRAEILEAVASRCGRLKVKFHLDRSRMTRWAESPLGLCLPLGAHRRPHPIREVSADPVFGLELYAAISQAKIVLNGAVDMAGEDRGNMRCFEAMGCGSLLISDEGRYPQGMENDRTLLTYCDTTDAIARIVTAHAGRSALQSIAAAGHEMVRTRYSKAAQWRDFTNLCN